MSLIEQDRQATIQRRRRLFYPEMFKRLEAAQAIKQEELCAADCEELLPCPQDSQNTELSPEPDGYEPPLIDPKKRPKVRDIAQACCNFYGVTLYEVVSVRRLQRIITCRHVAMYLACQITTCSFPQICKLFERDHSSVYHANDSIKAKIAADPQLAHEIDLIRGMLA